MSRNVDEGLRVAYSLRSSFFYRKLYELGFMRLLEQVEELQRIADSFQWSDRAVWGITASTWDVVTGAKLVPVQVFAHPSVLIQQPPLTTYYRSIAAIPQKGMKNLAFGTEAYERGAVKALLSSARAEELTILLNTHISLIIDSSTNFTHEDLIALLYASAGVQIDGSWRNAIGAEAEAVVRRLIVSNLVDGDYVIGLVNNRKAALPFNSAAEILELLPVVYTVRLRNGAFITFSSEPDLSLYSAVGRLVAAIEVKGGKDTAGALERYGAAKKSFAAAKRDNPDVATMFIASCITPEVESQMSSDPDFQLRYNLTSVINDEQARSEFLTKVRTLLGL